MDNHRAAIWCWANRLSSTINKDYDLFHIDKHYDTLDSQLDLWISKLNSGNSVDQMTVYEFLECAYHHPDMGTDLFPLFRWDNYIPIFIKLYPNLIHDIYFSTHGSGTLPSWIEAQEVSPWKTHEFIEWKFSENSRDWIINLDLDYFYYKNDEQYSQLFSDEYINSLCSIIQRHISTNTDSILTISLSPECCGGWVNAETMLKKVCAPLAINFSLPA